MSLTPHGPGFSFLDEIDRPGGEPPRLRGRKRLAAELPFFADHFPDRPLMPGVLIIEMAAQAAGALWGALTAPESAVPEAFVLAQVADFRLRHPATPGDVLVCEVRLERDFGGLAQFFAEVAIESSGAIAGAGKITLARPPVG